MIQGLTWVSTTRVTIEVTMLLRQYRLCNHIVAKQLPLLQLKTYFTESTSDKETLKTVPPSSTFSLTHQHSLTNNSLKHKLTTNQPLRGMHTTFYGDTSHIEQVGLLGYDFLWAEAEHSSASPESIERMILAAERRGLPTVVRVGYGYQNIIGHIQKYLTSGAVGIILPQCETAEDAFKLVEAVKFPPLGRRGLAGDRWNNWGLGSGGSMKKRVEDANNNSVCGVMIENRTGLNNLEAILKVEGIDFVSFGPTDLSADLGFAGEIRHPEVVAMVEEASKKILAAGKATGTIVLNQQDYEYWRTRGHQVICCVAQHIFVEAAKNVIDQMDEYEGVCDDVCVEKT